MGKFEPQVFHEIDAGNAANDAARASDVHDVVERARARIAIADHHRIVAESLGRICAREFEVVAVATDGEALLNIARRIPIDLIVSEVSIARQSGVAILKRLRAEGHRIRFVFVTSKDQPMVVSAAIRAGANGYLLKTERSSELLAAVRVALAGGVYLTPSLAADYFRGEGVGSGRLTKRQKEILTFLVGGASVRDIAGALKLSIRTVETHKQMMMKALNVRSAAALVYHAKELGFAI